MVSDGAAAAPPPSSITLHSSWRGTILGALGAGAVFAIGVALSISTGGAVIAVAMAIVGGIFLLTSLFDFPVASTFDANGVERRAVLRRHRIEWGRVDQLTRTRPTLAGRTLKPGGLAAKIGRRRYLLVDQCESLAEFDALGAIVGDRYVPLGLDEMILPPVDTDPTWTYRRKQWER